MNQTNISVKKLLNFKKGSDLASYSKEELTKLAKTKQKELKAQLISAERFNLTMLLLSLIGIAVFILCFFGVRHLPQEYQNAGSTIGSIAFIGAYLSMMLIGGNQHQIDGQINELNSEFGLN